MTSGRRTVTETVDFDEMIFDMHCHTKEGSLDSKVPIEQYIEGLIEKGFDGMLVSDHNTYNGYRYWKKHIKGKKFPDFVVLKGIEYDTIDGGHILVIMPENVRLKILELRGLPIQLLIDIVHKNGGILGPAHPCGERHLSLLNTGKHRNKPEIVRQFDFIEGFNACEEEEHNKKAVELAELYQKPVFGGSDAHKMECVGLGKTMLTRKITCESDLIRLIKCEKCKASTCAGEYFCGTTKKKIGKMNHVLVESFWIYNHLGSLRRRRKRRKEMKKIS